MRACHIVCSSASRIEISIFILKEQAVFLFSSSFKLTLFKVYQT